ncbi:MAG: hypothetical protein WB870_03195 [Gallionellaceae bacterium]
MRRGKTRSMSGLVATLPGCQKQKGAIGKAGKQVEKTAGRVRDAAEDSQHRQEAIIEQRSRSRQCRSVNGCGQSGSATGHSMCRTHEHA